MSQKEGTELRASLLCSLMQRCEAPAVRGVDGSLEPDEQCSNVQVAVRGGVVQGDETTL